MAILAASRRKGAAGAQIVGYASYVVRMDVFADPTVPPMTTEEIESADFGQALDDLVGQMDGMTADDLQDSVHRRFEFRLCPACHQAWRHWRQHHNDDRAAFIDHRSRYAA